MDDQGEKRNLALLRWREVHQMAIVQAICLVVYYYINRKRSQRSMIERTLTLEKEKVRAKDIRIKRPLTEESESIETYEVNLTMFKVLWRWVMTLKSPKLKGLKGLTVKVKLR